MAKVNICQKYVKQVEKNQRMDKKALSEGISIWMLHESHACISFGSKRNGQDKITSIFIRRIIHKFLNACPLITQLLWLVGRLGSRKPV